MAEKKPTAYGNLFRNKDYRPGIPEFRGDAVIPVELLRQMVALAKDGKEVKLSVALWPKESERAGRYFNLSMTEFVDWKRQAPPQQPPKKPEIDDDIPF